MFGGLGGEVYYRPFNSNFSSSIQFHRVQQRNFDQKFGFRDYRVNTGHLSFYYDFPKGIQSQFMIGKYLAGDKGATFDLRRTFDNGFAVGTFFTLTDVSAIEYGEGSFDKGLYFQIPFGQFSSRATKSSLSGLIRPLQREYPARNLLGLESTKIPTQQWLLWQEA